MGMSAMTTYWLSSQCLVHNGDRTENVAMTLFKILMMTIRIPNLCDTEDFENYALHVRLILILISYQCARGLSHLFKFIFSYLIYSYIIHYTFSLIKFITIIQKITMASIKKIGVLGAGVIGASWTALFVARGLTVTVVDVQPTAGDFVLSYVQKAWPLLQNLGLVVEGASPEKFTFSTDMKTAFTDVDFIQENSPERLDIKHTILKNLDSIIPEHAIIASSSSGLTCSSMQEADLKFPERLCIGHPFNPPHFIPLVEIVGGEKTSEATKQTATEFYRLIGKKPILVKREVTGHIANRLQSALMREVFHLMSNDIASISDIETAMEYGPGLRWGAMGPNTIFSLGGGAGGAAHFADHLLGPALSWYAKEDPILNDETKAMWVEQTNAAIAGRDAEQLIAERDQIITGILNSKKEKTS